MTPTLYIAAAALAAGLVAGAGGARVYYRGLMAEARAEALEQAAKAREQADLDSETQRHAGRAYEAWRARQQQKAAQAARRIDGQLQGSPGWAGTALPAGVRDELERAAAEAAGTSQPDGAVPAVPGTPATPQ